MLVESAFVFRVAFARRQASRKLQQFVFQAKDDFFSLMIVLLADAANFVG